MADAVLRLAGDHRLVHASISEVAGRSSIVVCTLDCADRRVLPLVFLADTLRGLGSDRITLVALYLGYMRQDRRFQPGEAVTSSSFAGLLSRAGDGPVTVDRTSILARRHLHDPLPGRARGAAAVAVDRRAGRAATPDRSRRRGKTR